MKQFFKRKSEGLDGRRIRTAEFEELVEQFDKFNRLFEQPTPTEEIQAMQIKTTVDKNHKLVAYYKNGEMKPCALRLEEESE